MNNLETKVLINSLYAQYLMLSKSNSYLSSFTDQMKIISDYSIRCNRELIESLRPSIPQQLSLNFERLVEGLVKTNEHILKKAAKMDLHLPSEIDVINKNLYSMANSKWLCNLLLTKGTSMGLFIRKK